MGSVMPSSSPRFGIPTTRSGQAAGTLLPASLGGAVLVGYAALAALAAVAAPLRRDIT
ncbi:MULTISPECIES: hypothetical protein [unclassified Nonomuraea]|uniref:hypothetical protein n=1 Tax=unclassified Nonomuraea TaxID=2593643 RepID=UPI00137863DF|nr:MULTISPECIES: hypothetical protein [unclassified Nonomuraea]NBE99279.1 hypothetical protein [Nonomuraea sp. K271]